MSRVLVIFGLFGKKEIKHQATKPTGDSWVAGRTCKQSVALPRSLPSVETQPFFEFAHKCRITHLCGVSLNHEVKDILHVLFIREQLNPNAISRAGYFQKPQFVV